MNRRQSEQQAQEVLALYRGGARCKEIARELGCSEYRVWYVLRSRGAAPPRSRRERLLREIFAGGAA